MRHGSVTKAVMSAVVLVGLVVGVPAALWLVAGSPVPGGLPSMGEVRSTLSSPDYTGTVLMGVLKVVGWVAWATFAWATLAELVAQARHRAAPRLRGLGFQQQVAGVLVAAVFAGFAWQAAASSSAVVGLPPPAAPVVQVVAPADPVAPVQRHAAAPTDQVQAGATATHTVVKGDTFWGLAAKYLGDGTRWREVYGLNDGREMPGGHTLCDPGWLEPGWELLVPAPDEAPGVEHTRTVVRGDTLSQIALEELGDASRYPELFDASAATVQPDGRQLSNPDLIYPGWQVTVPGTVGAKTPPQTPTAPPPAGQPPVDQSQQTTPAGGPGEQGTVVQQPRRQEAPPNTTAEGQAGAQAPDRWAPWVLVGLTGGGTVLAGSVWLALRARRQARSRHRRPGMALPAPGALLAPVEKTVVTVGPGMAPLVQYVDQVLRRLGAATAAGGGLMPDLVAVELAGSHVVLHLGEPWELGAPWQASDEGHVWRVPVGADLDLVGPPGEHPAPYPLLVTVGTGRGGSVWLFNAEDLAVTVVGDAERARDFARYMVAEIGCSPWAAWTTVQCVGMGAELVGLNPDRIRYHHPGAAGDPVGHVLAEAVTTAARASAAGTDVVTARAGQVGVESWAPQVVLVDATNDDPALDPLLGTIAAHVGCTGTSVVVAGERPGTGGVHIEVTSDGRVRLPEVGLDLLAVGLDIAEAAGCAGLIAHTETAVEPVPVPAHDDPTGWRAWSDVAGALLPEHTVPREDSWHNAPELSSVLPGPGTTYAEAAATTPEELDLLGPQVTDEVREQVEAADPTLDADLDAWADPDSRRPKITVLGPVSVTAAGTAPTRRQPFFTELVTYLALHPCGVSAAQVGEAFSASRNKAREYIRTVRTWLGTDPTTGRAYLHEAGEGRDALCQVDALVDLDLLRRLRVRGQTRGADGINDLFAALQLVGGPPFGDQTTWRPGGWSWLIDDQRADDAAIIAIIDTAHTIIVHTLATGDIQTGRLAARTAQLADPHAEIINLDLAALASAEGRAAEAARILAEDVGNRCDDGHAPPELPTRTQEILITHPGWVTNNQAS